MGVNPVHGTEPTWPAPAAAAWADLWVMHGSAPGEESNPVYDWSWNDALERITIDTAWTEWWTKAKRPRLEIRGELTWAPGPPILSYARDAIRLRYPVHVQRLATTDREELAGRARTDLALVLEVLAKRLRLPPCPPLPDQRPAPDDMPDQYTYTGVTADEVRAAILHSALDASLIEQVLAAEVLDEARKPYEHY